jgi:hypothetical protein
LQFFYGGTGFDFLPLALVSVSTPHFLCQPMATVGI